jgi:hypothetical protein
MNNELAERLIKISIDNPLLPETFIPWEDELGLNDVYLPPYLVSLYDTPFFETLTLFQKTELAKREACQVMYAYAWSETLFCQFITRRLLTIDPAGWEHKFLLRELIEECRHQEMFTRAIEKLNVKAITPGFWHRFFGNFTVKLMPHDAVFMSCLAVELMAEIYAAHYRKADNVYIVLKKVSQLHHIEEARHILFTEELLKDYTMKAGFVKRTWYSTLVMLNIYFMRTMYVKKEIFSAIGISDPKVYKMAQKNFKKNFGIHCLGKSIEFVQGFNGFNFITRPLWRIFLNAHV